MVSRAELATLRALGRRKNRDRSGLFLAEGVRLVEELLDSPVVPSVALVSPSLEDTERGRMLVAALRDRVRTEPVSNAELNAVATTESPQGVVVAAAIPRLDPDEWSPAVHSLVVLLDAVQDPGNFGTIVRTAEAFGAGLVIALPGTVDPWNPKAVRSAMGSSLRVPLLEMPVADAGALLTRYGFDVLGADAGGEDVAASARSDRVALVLGNEGAGLGESVAICHRMCAIPLDGRVESLNVGVAAGIMLYALTRKT